MAIRSSERKEWARETFVGLQNIVAPSFQVDLMDIDEAGIRLDVRQSKKHGFFASQCANEAGLSIEENRRFVEVVADEANGEILVGVSLFLDNQDEMLELLRHAERVGADFALLGTPILFNPASVDEAFDFARELCESTNLGIVVPAHPQRIDLSQLHPGGVPFELLDRLVALDNVVAIQIGDIDTGLISECFQRYREDVLVTSTFFGAAPLLSDTWGLQWSGGWIYEAVQSPDRPYAVELFDLVHRGKLDQAMKIYWELAPGVATVGHLQALFNTGANDYYMARKYFQWCVGGNGGLTRQPHFPLFERQRDLIRESYDAMDIETTGDDEGLFFLGRGQYDKA